MSQEDQLLIKILITSLFKLPLEHFLLFFLSVEKNLFNKVKVVLRNLKEI